ncbi:MAG TPA: ABC transporter substrate-binding protein [Chloroflexota bacterium]|nr:ABC transporter substrate-binding protein [Chloroflexota bacterium]
MRDRLAARLGVGMALLGLALACAPAASAPASKPPAPTSAPAATAAPATSAPAAAAPTTAAGQPALVSSPAVDLKVGVIPQASYAPFFIAQARGYFKELGLNVEFFPTGNIVDQLPAIAQGQLNVGSCSTGVPCFNALNRRVDVKIVADLQSAGKTEKSTGNLALVVRKAVWDAGTIRSARDLVGRSVYTIAGEGSGPHVVLARWLQRQGIDPRSVDISPMNYPEVFAAMQNGAVDVGFSTEPLVTAGLTRGVHEILATQEEMHPTTARLYAVYSSGIDRLGPQVGERFMVAYLRAARDYINAFEYGVDLDTIVDILVAETPLKDHETYKQIKYAWVDPNGLVQRETLEADAELFRQLDVMKEPLDLSGAFEPKYREFAVRYLGEYQPPAASN